MVTNTVHKLFLESTVIHRHTNGVYTQNTR